MKPYKWAIFKQIFFSRSSRFATISRPVASRRSLRLVFVISEFIYSRGIGSLEIRSSLSGCFDVLKARPPIFLHRSSSPPVSSTRERAHIQVLLSAEIQLLLPSSPPRGRETKDVRRQDLRATLPGGKIHRGERGSVTPALQKTDTKARRPCSALFSPFAYLVSLSLNK